MVARRPVPSAHDRVVAAIAAQASNYIAYTNIGGHHSAYLIQPRFEVSPDIVLCDSENWMVEHVIEVEADDTVVPASAQRWLSCARAVRHRGKFWLLVPANAVRTATRLCQQYRIPARIGAWTFDGQNVSVDWSSQFAPATMKKA